MLDVDDVCQVQVDWSKYIPDLNFVTVQEGGSTLCSIHAPIMLSYDTRDRA